MGRSPQSHRRTLGRSLMPVFFFNYDAYFVLVFVTPIRGVPFLSNFLFIFYFFVHAHLSAGLVQFLV